MVEPWPFSAINISEDHTLKTALIMLDDSCLSRVDFLRRALIGRFGNQERSPPGKEKVVRWAENRWKPVGEVIVRNLNPSLFLFVFASVMEADRVLEGGGWKYDGEPVPLTGFSYPHVNRKNVGSVLWGFPCNCGGKRFLKR